MLLLVKKPWDFRLLPKEQFQVLIDGQVHTFEKGEKVSITRDGKGIVSVTFRGCTLHKQYRHGVVTAEWLENV